MRKFLFYLFIYLLFFLSYLFIYLFILYFASVSDRTAAAAATHGAYCDVTDKPSRSGAECGLYIW